LAWPPVDDITKPMIAWVSASSLQPVDVPRIRQAATATQRVEEGRRKVDIEGSPGPAVVR